MTFAIVILLVLIAALFLRSQVSKKQMPAGSSDWVILEWHKAADAGGSEKAPPGSGPSIHIQFVPIIGWEYDGGRLVPMTPPGTDVFGRLDKRIIDQGEEYETTGYWIRDGAVYSITDMKPVDFWTDLFNNAFARTRIEVHGNVPDSYKKRLFDIVTLSEKDELDVNKLLE